MKCVTQTGAVLIVIVIVIGSLLYLFPSDVVTSNYRSLDEARADQLFDRGWLPDILPPSAHSIHISNNLDLNTSDGWFSISTSEYGSFTARLKMYAPIASPFVAFDKDAEKMIRKDFKLLSYEEGNSIWIFFCKSETGFCEYTMSPR